MKREDLQIGQVVYVSSEHTITPPQEYEIESIGRKYLTLKGYRNKFEIESGLMVSEYGKGQKIYTDIQELLGRKEKQKHKNTIESFFRKYSHTTLPLTLDELRTIVSITNHYT